MSKNLCDRIKKTATDIGRAATVIFKRINSPDDFNGEFSEYLYDNDIDIQDMDNIQPPNSMAANILDGCIEDVEDILRDIDTFKVDVDTRSIDTISHDESRVNRYLYKVYSGDIYGNGGVEDLYLLLEELERKRGELVDLYDTIISRYRSLYGNRGG